LIKGCHIVRLRQPAAGPEAVDDLRHFGLLEHSLSAELLPFGKYAILEKATDFPLLDAAWDLQAARYEFGKLACCEGAFHSTLVSVRELTTETNLRH